MVSGVEDRSASMACSSRLKPIGRSPEGHEHRERRSRRCGRRGREGELPRELAAGALGTPVTAVLPVLARDWHVPGGMLVPMHVPIPMSVSGRFTL
jgi:hypothetical protein